MYSPRSDSPNEKTRRNRVKMISSNRVITVVLLLAAVCLLWTTEWMDRLQIFGNSLAYTKVTTQPEAHEPSNAGDGARSSGGAFSVDESSLPVENDEFKRQVKLLDDEEILLVDENETEYTGDLHINEERDPLESDSRKGQRYMQQNTATSDDEDESEPQDNHNLPRLKICVISSNPRTASLFQSRTLERIGGGKFDYIVAPKKCPADAVEAPVTVRMLYQKTLAAMGASQVNALFDNPENLIVVMGDEFCRCPLEICSQKAHARQYYSESYVEFTTKYPAPDANPTVYLPLGPRYEFPSVHDDEIIPSSMRKLLFNLIVSPTSPSRKRLASMVARKSDAFKNVFVHVTPAFAGNASEAKGYVAPEEYRQTLLDSQFTLCPAGHNPEAFRLFEASEAGSIPVIVRDEEYLNHECKDSFAPLLASGAPFIVLKNWDELEQALRPYRENPALLDELQSRLKDWYKKFWRGVSRDFECSIVQNIEKSLKRQGARIKSIEDKYDLPECLDDADVEEEEETAKHESKAVAASPKISSTPLIVGCGRTGTLSLSHYLVQAVGVKSVHEKMEQNAISVSWLYAKPSAVVYPFEGKRSPKYRKWKAKRLAKLKLPLFDPVVHLVRHPLKVISSTRRCFCGRGTRSTGLGQKSDALSWQFVDAHIEMPKPNLPYDSLLRSMTYWYEWNKLIEREHKVVNRFRIEDLDPRALVKALEIDVPEGVELPNRVPKAPSHVSPEAEKKLIPDSTWADLAGEDRKLAERIFALARKYGYEPKASSLDDLI